MDGDLRCSVKANDVMFEVIHKTQQNIIIDTYAI